jgi:hypothetical protein
MDDFADELADIFEEFIFKHGLTDEEEAELVLLIHNEFEAPWRNVRLSHN